MIAVRVPATSANIGPGFDALGVAVSLYATVRFARSEKLLITGAQARYCDADNLVYAAYLETLAYLGLPKEPVKIDIESDIPVARGLGSSAAMYVAGALGAAAMHGRRLEKEEVLLITNALEGHPDNLAPAIWGGFTAALTHEGKPYAALCPVAEGIKLCAFIPDFSTLTHEARAALPAFVSHKDAAYAVAHALALVGALRTGDEAALGRAVSDTLHEPYRKKLIPGFDEVRARAKRAGCTAFFISGSGSACMAFYRDAGFPARAAREMEPLADWRVLPLEIDHEGAKIIRE